VEAFRGALKGNKRHQKDVKSNLVINGGDRSIEKSNGHVIGNLVAPNGY